jgi:hypothetical protein
MQDMIKILVRFPLQDARSIATRGIDTAGLDPGIDTILVRITIAKSLRNGIVNVHGGFNLVYLPRSS